MSHQQCLRGEDENHGLESQKNLAGDGLPGELFFSCTVNRKEGKGFASP